MRHTMPSLLLICVAVCSCPVVCLCQGWASGSSNDSEECLQFAHAFGIKVITETFPLEKAADVYDAMNANKIRFRGVLVMDKKQ